jgi:hypothetical protein
MSEDFVASGEVSTGGYGGESPTDQAHIDAMTAKADAGLSTGPKAEKLYAGKYKSEEDLQKGILELAAKQSGSLEEFYKTLEKGFGKQEPAAESSPETESAEADTAAESDADPESSEAADPSTATGAIELASSEWAEKGELSQETFDALEKVGISKAMVQEFIEGQEAKAEKAIGEIMNIVGGEKAYEHMKAWAMANCTQDEIKQFNAAIVSNDIPRIKMAMRGMNALYIEREGKAPNLLKPSSAAAANAGAYESKAQMVADMRDQRYATDPAFRQHVMARVKASKF